MLPSACRLGVAHAKQDVNGKQLKSTNAIITFSAKRKTTGQQPPGATPRRYPLAESCEALCRGRFGTPIGAKLWSISQTRPVWDSHRTANQLGWFGVNSSAVLWQSQTGRGPGWPLRLGITSQLRLSHAVGQSGEQCQSAQGHEAAGLSRMSHDVASGPLKATMFLVPQPPPLSV